MKLETDWEYIKHLQYLRSTLRKPGKIVTRTFKPKSPDLVWAEKVKKVTFILSNVAIANLGILQNKYYLNKDAIIEKMLSPTLLVLGETFYDEDNKKWFTQINLEGELISLVAGDTEYVSKARAEKMMYKL